MCCCLSIGFKDEAENEVALNEWRLEIERILAVMVEVFPAELRDTYLTTVVEQEVHNTVLMSQELAKRSIWVWRGATDDAGGDSGDLEQRRRLHSLQDNLRGQLADKHIVRVDDKLADKLAQHLTTTLDKIIAEDLAKVSITICIFLKVLKEFQRFK